MFCCRLVLEDSKHINIYLRLYWDWDNPFPTARAVTQKYGYINHVNHVPHPEKIWHNPLKHDQCQCKTQYRISFIIYHVINRPYCITLQTEPSQAQISTSIKHLGMESILTNKIIVLPDKSVNKMALSCNPDSLHNTKDNSQLFTNWIIFNLWYTYLWIIYCTVTESATQLNNSMALEPMQLMFPTWLSKQQKDITQVSLSSLQSYHMVLYHFILNAPHHLQMHIIDQTLNSQKTANNSVSRRSCHRHVVDNWLFHIIIWLHYLQCA